MQQALYLDKFGEQDFPLYYSLSGDARVMALITQRALTREEAAAHYRQILLRNIWHTDFGYFKASDRSGRFMGLAKLQPELNWDFSQADLGYLLLPQYWGQGYGSALAAQMLQQADRVAELRQITATIHTANTASRRILLKLGFCYAGNRQLYSYPAELYHLERQMTLPPAKPASASEEISQWR